MSDFERELAALINRYSQDSTLNTPDYILAQYLTGCLAAFAEAMRQMERWPERPLSRWKLLFSSRLRYEAKGERCD